MFQSIFHCLKQRANALGSPAGWDWVLSDPVVNCFSPALYILDQEGFIHLSIQLYQKSWNIYWQNVASYLTRENELQPILENLKEANIKVIPLKGAALLESIYKKHTGLRLMTDIDLLVQPEDFLRSVEILLDEGLQPKWRYPSGNLFEFSTLPRKFWPGELSFLADHNLHIDLHCNFITSHWYKIAYPVDVKEVWKRSKQTKNEFFRDPNKKGNMNWDNILSPYDMLAHMCLHLGLHGLQNIKNFLDVDLWLRSLPDNWDWQQFIEISNDWQIGSCSYHTFLFTNYFFNTPLPDEVMQILNPGILARWQVRQLLTPKSLLLSKMCLGKRYPVLVKFFLLNNLIIKFKTIKNLIFPSKSWIKNNPDNRKLLLHWIHIFNVALRRE